jgi:hypothetical protein
MAVKIDNYAGTLEFTAPAGGVTAFVPVLSTGTNMLHVPCVSQTSGKTYPAWVAGVIIRGADVATGDGWTVGDPAVWGTGAEFALPATGVSTICHAVAAETIASGTESGDFVLRLPFNFTRP